MIAGDSQRIGLRRWRYFALVAGFVFLAGYSGSGRRGLRDGCRRRLGCGVRRSCRCRFGRGFRCRFDGSPQRCDLALGAGAGKRGLVLACRGPIDIFLDDDALAGEQLCQLGLVGIEQLGDPGLDFIRVRAIADLAGKCDFE